MSVLYMRAALDVMSNHTDRESDFAIFISCCFLIPSIIHRVYNQNVIVFCI